MFSGVGDEMKNLTKVEHCHEEVKVWRGEAFWVRVDKLMAIFDHPAYWYFSIGLILFGTILGVVANNLK